MRVAVITKIFPSSLEPLSAPFNRQQIGELARRCDVDVLAAIPYVPLASVTSIPARAAKLAALPTRERLDDVDVTYVRQLYAPRIGLSIALPLYLASLAPHWDRLRAADVLLGTWAYPDGCAAIVAALALGKPCVVKVHGTDVNTVLKRPVVRAMASAILPRADAVVAVSQALAEELVALGVARTRVHLVRNGADLSLFRERDRGDARRSLGLPESARVVLYVGRLEAQKGIRELLAAFETVRTVVPSAVLVLVGHAAADAEHEVRARTEAWAPGALRIAGARPHAEVAEWIGACDVLALPSWAEGTPNVVLEALASGRPVVATRVGGIPDVIVDDDCGLLVAPRDAPGLATAIATALGRTWDEGAVRARGPGSWQKSAGELLGVLESVVRARPAEQSRRAGGSPRLTQSVRRP
jgi:teichuronic acid biosynthesis glycosyltransferase TuaC